MRTTIFVLFLLALTSYSYLSSNSTGMEKFDVEPGGHKLAKDDPVFMESMNQLKATAPQAHELVMEKVDNGATVAEIKQYIYSAE